MPHRAKEIQKETRFAELKRYVRFDDAAADCVSKFRPIAEPHFKRIVEQFYDRIREHEEAHAVLVDEAQIERLKRSLVLWMERLLSGKYDEAYFEETSKIGRRHVNVGLAQRYMFSAMALIRAAFDEVVDREVEENGRSQLRSALHRLLDLELAIMLDAYRDDYVQRIQRVERQEKLAVTEALVRTEHRYLNAVELARVLIVGLDQAGRVKLFNREAEMVTGFYRDEVIGKAFGETMVEPGHSAHGEIERALAGDSEPATIEAPFRMRSGKVREIRWRLAYSKSEVDDDIVLFAVGQDVTDERALAERTRVSEKLASVGTLAAGLAHEIRNPLNGAKLHLKVLERALSKADGPKESLDAVNVVSEEIDRLASLVTEFLDFARPKPLVLTAVSLNDVCARVRELALGDPLAEGLTIELDFPSNALVVQGDAGKLEQVFLNLVTNALAAMKEGGGSVVRIRGRRRPNDVIVDVEDNGPGIAEAHAPIFDAFYTTKAAGTGLGLSIVHRIVTDHNGSIDMTRDNGLTVFRVSLPIG